MQLAKIDYTRVRRVPAKTALGKRIAALTPSKPFEPSLREQAAMRTALYFFRYGTK